MPRAKKPKQEKREMVFDSNWFYKDQIEYIAALAKQVKKTKAELIRMALDKMFELPKPQK